MSRFDEIVEMARASYTGTSDACREQHATDFLAQWVCQLENDLKETKERLKGRLTSAERWSDDWD